MNTLIRRALGRALRLLPDRAHATIDSVYWATRIARDPAGFYRYLRLLLQPRAPVHLQLRGLGHPIYLRPGTTDALVAYGALGEAYHRPPVALPESATIIDLGANIGLTAADLAARHPGATVVAVELDPGNAALAARNTATYGNRVTILNGAAWWEATELSYTAERGEEWGFALSEQGGLPVRGIALADLIEQYGPVDYLKMDIEGAEREVLSRNTSWAQAVRVIQVEVHQPYTLEQCERDLRALGFTTERHPRHPASVNGVRDGSA
jgi:FkbM family methyltransferase